jgi:hypothetical protein
LSVIEDFVVGRTVDFGEINSCLVGLEDRWRSSCHVLRSGEAGWYRRLSVADRVGVVATAQAMIALRMMGTGVPHIDAIVRTLMALRRDDGAWAFVSNLSDVGVVDATAWSLLALYEWRNEKTFRHLLATQLEDSLDWLESVALQSGGWGIIPEGSHRSYSTALAVQTLCNCGRRSSMVVQRAIHHLISVADPGTGAWYDASRRLSVPTTAEVVRAFSAAADDQSTYSAELTKACNWLLNIGQQTNLWIAGPGTAYLEEVEVELGTRRIRVEYGHSPRPVAITALSAAGQADTPEVVAAMRMLVGGILSNRWGEIAGGRYLEPTSWMLHDICTAIVHFRGSFSKRTVAVWADYARVVELSQGQGGLVCTVRKHWPKFGIAAGCVLVAWMLVRAGIVKASIISLVLFVVAPLVLNLISNFIFEFLNHRRRGKSD